MICGSLVERRGEDPVNLLLRVLRKGCKNSCQHESSCVLRFRYSGWPDVAPDFDRVDGLLAVTWGRSASARVRECKEEKELVLTDCLLDVVRATSIEQQHDHGPQPPREAVQRGKQAVLNAALEEGLDADGVSSRYQRCFQTRPPFRIENIRDEAHFADGQRHVGWTVGLGPDCVGQRLEQA